MTEQRIQNRSLSGWRGVALVLAAALAMILGSGLFHALGCFIGSAATLLFIAYGCAIAWFMLYWFVMGFIYHCDGSCLRIYRAYGKRQRPMLEVWLHSIQALGSLQELQGRFPGARVQRALRPECPIEPMAVAYRYSGKVSILLIQPDDEMKRALLAAVKRKR